MREKFQGFACSAWREGEAPAKPHFFARTAARQEPRPPKCAANAATCGSPREKFSARACSRLSANMADKPSRYIKRVLICAHACVWHDPAPRMRRG